MTEQRKTRSSLLRRVKLQNMMVADLRIPAATMGVFFTLASHADNDTGKCYPSHATLQRLTGIRSKTTLLKHLSLLCETGYIEIESGRAAKKSNYYTIIFDGPVTASSAQAAIGDQSGKKMNAEGSNFSKPSSKKMDTELTSDKLTKLKLSMTAPKPDEAELVQSRKERGSLDCAVKDGRVTPKQAPRQDPVDRAALAEGRQINEALRKNHQAPDPQVLASARAYLSKYGHEKPGDRPLTPEEVLKFMGSGRWKLPSQEELEDLIDDLVSTISSEKFKAASKQVRRSYKHFWREPPTFQSFINAAEEVKTAPVGKPDDPYAQLIGQLKLNLRTCEMYA